MTPIEKQAHDLGWELEQTRKPCEPLMFRAVQGGFSTPWRPTPEMVLADLQEMSRIERALDQAEDKLR